MNEYLVVRCDNYGRSGETPGYDEVFESDKTMTQAAAKRKATLLNKPQSPYGDYYYRAEPAGYKLAKFEP